MCASTHNATVGELPTVAMAQEPTESRPSRAREIVAVRRDAAGAITHLVIGEETGRHEIPVEEAILDRREQPFFAIRAGEALLVIVRRIGGQVVLVNPLQGRIDVPVEKS